MATLTADPREVRTTAKQLADEFITCRDVGHTWRTYKVTKVRGGYNRDLFCPTCKTTRHEFISNRGEKSHTAYTYPEGYQIRGLGRIVGDGRNILRLESVIRAMDHAVETQGDSAVLLPYDETTGELREG